MTTRWTWVIATAGETELVLPPNEDLTSHVEELAHMKGSQEALFLKTEPHEHSAGTDPGFTYCAAVRTTDPSSLLNDPKALWGPLDGRVSDVQIHLRDELCYFDASPIDASWITAVRVDFTPTREDAAKQEHEFNDWYTFEHVSDICRGTGFHRGWRMEREDDGPFQRYWVFYESDAPENLAESRQGKASWGGIWGDVISQDTFCRSYHRVMASSRRA